MRGHGLACRRQVSVFDMSDRWAWGVRLIMGSYVVVCAVGSFVTA